MIVMIGFTEFRAVFGKKQVISHTADICFLRKRKLELIVTFRNAGNVKTDVSVS